MIEYPEYIAKLSREYYYHRISTETYREERRKIIMDMERLHNREHAQQVKADHAVDSDDEFW